VTEASNVTASDSLAAGWDELRGARWGAARELFEAALAVEETPEAQEGLSWAAWWLDDADTVFAAREAAYRLYRRRGDAAGAARMATWLAVDQLDFRAAWAVANGWLRRAHRLLDPLEPAPEHGWLAFQEGYVAHSGGQTEKASELAVYAARLGRRFGVADLEMLGLALEGATLVSCARVDEGMRCLDEATATALEGEATIPISSAWTFCFLVSACTATLDFERASEWCQRNEQFAERYGSRFMLAFCRAECGTMHLWRGRWREAEAMLEASVEDFGISCRFRGSLSRALQEATRAEHPAAERHPCGLLAGSAEKNRERALPAFGSLGLDSQSPSIPLVERDRPLVWPRRHPRNVQGRPNSLRPSSPPVRSRRGFGIRARPGPGYRPGPCLTTTLSPARRVRERR
jgi:hypothetical protein